MKNTLYIISIFLLFTACSNPLTKPYKEATGKEDLKEITDSKKIDERDAKMLRGYIVLAKLEGKAIEGKTYQELFDEAAKIKKEKNDKDAILRKEQDELAARAKKEEEECRQKMAAVLTVTMSAMEFNTTSPTEADDFVYTFSLENKSDKNIKQMGGTVTLSDIAGTELKQFYVHCKNAIPAHQTVVWSHHEKYNQTDKGDLVLRSTDMKDLKVDWSQYFIEFADGSELYE